MTPSSPYIFLSSRICSTRHLVPGAPLSSRKQSGCTNPGLGLSPAPTPKHPGLAS